jgi:hypothetical protein
MAIQILNDGASLRIVNAASVLLINKSHIKTIDTVRDNTIRLDISSGALKNIFIKFSEVTIPAALPDVYALRDAINSMLQTNTAGLATEQKQDVQIELLSGILSALNEIKITIGNLKCCGCGQIMRIDESNPLVTYVGYAAAGSQPNQAVWSIQRTTRFATNDIVIVEWADGNELFDNIWDQRLELNYQALGGPAR